ncbi:hypothetical protein CHARACLAT_029421 [Characodon lateralis]|uniref:Uncharacterized protein n=1 Tax=Characodon lateralis TaxID=208331 RepID=A0ABU7E4V4_9TELE|nr:hypothetical protein [Characodon lateralis]
MWFRSELSLLHEILHHQGMIRHHVILRELENNTRISEFCFNRFLFQKKFLISVLAEPDWFNVTGRGGIRGLGENHLELQAPTCDTFLDIELLSGGPGGEEMEDQ